MKRVYIRVFKLEETKDFEGKVIEKFVAMPGEFVNDRTAWDSITEDGKYQLMLIFEHTTEKKEA